MKTTIQLHDFVHCDALKGNFSYDGRVALFEYLVGYEDDTGEELEFDPIGIRCDYAEYENIAAFWQDYNSTQYQCMTDIADDTQVITIPNSDAFIIGQF